MSHTDELYLGKTSYQVLGKHRFATTAPTR